MLILVSRRDIYVIDFHIPIAYEHHETTPHIILVRDLISRDTRLK
jgi:hypothetical protein